MFELAVTILGAVELPSIVEEAVTELPCGVIGLVCCTKFLLIGGVVRVEPFKFETRVIL